MPISPGASATPRRFERFEGFPGDEATSVHASQQEQGIRGQMREILVPRLVLAPASAEFQAQDGELLDGWFPPLIANREAITPGFELGDLGL